MGASSMARVRSVTDPVPPAILQGSGVVLFNQKALEAATAHQYPATGAKKAYQVQIKFEYNPGQCSPAGAIAPPNQG
ncbi:MAG: hypothetical protein HC772_17590 [Leptolyngbyaceae cyanobacterium CRU_2_3]|nr:hypothetical protein [Leptolyngbyaceae cyanobacterium CRU_2_3]